MPRDTKVTQPSPAADPTSIVPTTTSTAVSSPDLQTLRQRAQPGGFKTIGEEKMANHDTPSSARAVDDEGPLSTSPASWTSKNQWVVLAVASGACAAFNGVFAKLTTTDLTTTISQSIAEAFGLAAVENALELIVRATFFGLNLVFNGVMWTLFTKALARGSSTTQVSIMNTSTNFMITAVLGLMIFSESLPPLWWVGAAMLVAGNVIIGRKVEETKESVEEDHDVPLAGPSTNTESYGAVPLAGGVLPVEKDDDEDVALLGDLDDARS